MPFLVVAFSIRRLVHFGSTFAGSKIRIRGGSAVVAFACVAALACWLDFSREQMWHPQLVLWSICVAVVAATLVSFAIGGGRAVAVDQAFPVLFLLTAVPWPPRIEQPITSTLMRWVASATTELLHWLGIQAQTSGGAIALHDGVVGITEACSGIRSLQAGIMFGLAMGEWFLLSTARRVVLLAIAIALAFATNLGRTLLLALHADRHGTASVESVHDMIGNIMITSLIILICGAGKVLSRSLPAADRSFGRLRSSTKQIAVNASRSAGKIFAGGAFGLIIGLAVARTMSAQIEARDHSQLAPFFSVRPDLNSGGSAQRIPIPREIWNELRPTSGEYVRLERSDLPLGSSDSYHFFWKPSPWNRFALVHRPDICMPGIGWQQSHEPEPVQVNFGNRSVRCYAFRFRRGNVHALELWGVWRNGEPVSLDYSADQALGSAAAPVGLQLAGKRRSATEIVACSVMSENEPPATNTAVRVMESLFEYSPR